MIRFSYEVHASQPSGGLSWRPGVQRTARKAYIDVTAETEQEARAEARPKAKRAFPGHDVVQLRLIKTEDV